jgi:hypothetical protein
MTVKSFIKLKPGANVINFLRLQVMNVNNKLEYLFLARLSTSQMFEGKAGNYPSEALFR